MRTSKQELWLRQISNHGSLQRRGRPFSQLKMMSSASHFYRCSLHLRVFSWPFSVSLRIAGQKEALIVPPSLWQSSRWHTLTFWPCQRCVRWLEIIRHTAFIGWRYPHRHPDPRGSWHIILFLLHWGSDGWWTLMHHWRSRICLRTGWASEMEPIKLRQIIQT